MRLNVEILNNFFWPTAFEFGIFFSLRYTLLCTLYACNSRLNLFYLTTFFIGKQWHLKTEMNSQNSQVWETVGKNNA